ncbi:FecR family protein [Larkinella insperata]|uniref:FecR family protein n=1 Tax=Larkinella insperata TaxID=332158 RepID=A0ABW3QHK7_9BACT
MKPEISKEMVFHYFEGRATAFQKELIEGWARESVNFEQFFVWLQEWENKNLQYASDVEVGIARHRNRMNDQNRNSANPSSQPGEVAGRNRFLRSIHTSWLVAASLLIVMLAAGLLFKDLIRYQTYTTDYGEIRRLQLPDGSKVVLNANSSLRVPRFGFGADTREVHLRGEANFAVEHTPSHQRFVVKTEKNFNVEVLGTEFNVYARPLANARVVLNKGKILLNYQKDHQIQKLLMKPGDLVTVDARGRAEQQKTANPQKYSAWKVHRFVFEKTSLKEVCALFKESFGLQVSIPDNNLAQLTISGSFTAINAEELLDILTEDSGLTYSRQKDGSVIIRASP